MNILETVEFLGELLSVLPAKQPPQRSFLERSNRIIKKLCIVFIILAFIFFIIGMSIKYVPVNGWLVIPLVFSLSLFTSIGFSVLLFRLFDVQYSYDSLIPLLFTMTLFLSSLIFLVNIGANQIFFKCMVYSSLQN